MRRKHKGYITAAMFSKAILTFVAIATLASINSSNAKIYGQCELANILRTQGVPEDQVATWVCIAHAESNFDTTAINTNTWDYGIFQISSIYWCNSGDTPGNGCGISCNSLLSDDITEDIACVRYIYQQTEAIGEIPGFKAWTTWAANCAGDNSGWIAGC